MRAPRFTAHATPPVGRGQGFYEVWIVIRAVRAHDHESERQPIKFRIHTPIKKRIPLRAGGAAVGHNAARNSSKSVFKSEKPKIT